MSTIAPISSTQPTSQPSQTTIDALNVQNQAVGGASTLGVNDFLKLLTVQLQNQDPLKPMDDTEFISQMANFTTLQQTQTLTSDFESYSKQSQMTSANSYIGTYVSVTDSALGTVTGAVTGVAIDSGTPKIVVNGVNYDLSAIQNVSWQAPTSVPVTSTPSSQ